MDPEVIFWTVVVVAAVVGGIAALVLAGPAGLLAASSLWANVGYFAMGAVIGAFLGAGAMKLGFGIGPGGGQGPRGGGVDGREAHFVLDVQTQAQSVRLKLMDCAGRTGTELVTLEYSPSLPNGSREALPQVIGQIVAKIHGESSSAQSETPMVKVRFAEGTQVMHHMILQELRQQGCRVALDCDDMEE